MKKVLIASLLSLSAASAWADAGPYYVSYPGYCNVKQVYVNAYGDVYGYEIGCTATLGQPLIGSIAPSGIVAVSVQNSQGMACLHSYWPNGTLHGGCSSGYGISYSPDSVYSVSMAAQRANASPSSGPTLSWKLQTTMPDVSTTRNLPPMPF